MNKPKGWATVLVTVSKNFRASDIQKMFKNHYQWCFLGSGVVHESTYDFPLDADVQIYLFGFHTYTNSEQTIQPEQ